MLEPYRVGDVLRVRQPYHRNRCAVCLQFMVDGPAPVCTRCGTSYRQVTDLDYQVVRLGPG